MNAEEYAHEIALISAAVANYVLKLGALFRGPALSVRDWLSLLEMIFPEVYRQRLEAAEVAREFYDSERDRHYPDLPRHEQPLVEYDFEEFVRDMDPVREIMSREEVGDEATGALALRAVRSVEIGGRKQIIRAVESDPLEDTPEPERDPVLELVEERLSRSERIEIVSDAVQETTRDSARDPFRDEVREARERNQPVQGWARVATGEETCAWCLMLISRGPVYRSAGSAGLDLDDEGAARMIAAGEDVRPFMEQWHTGCDCKVVPVFDIGSWAGFDAWKRAEELWTDAVEDAREWMEAGKAKSDNLNRETINALRRRLERGDVSMTEFAFAA
ncbi:putative capsid maturation protease [Mycobacterium phage PP]|uniref:Putative capsid maturation protease n=1 Tax=Mycobacterium phage PP TaxID=2077134 RepID=A0A2Z5XVF4_9CAUD|nr:putative capsid maturation protease [Mycobacterium phage PP]BBC53817.1 putative capsid maturation protease [Mycobacterium phage PP]